MNIDPERLRATAAARRADEDRQRAAQQAREIQIRQEREREDAQRYVYEVDKFRERLPHTVQAELDSAASRGSTSCNVPIGTFYDSSRYRISYSAGIRAASEIADQLNSIPGVHAEVADERTVKGETIYGGMHGTTAWGHRESNVNEVSLRIDFES